MFRLALIALLYISTYAEETVLNRYSGTKDEDKIVYTLPIEIDKQTFKMRVNLNEGKPWLKSKDCKICSNLECKQSCTGKLGQAKEGLKCQKPSCTASNDEYNQNNVEGTEAQVEVGIGKKFKKSITMALINKVKLDMDNFTKQYDGVVNLLQQPQIFQDFMLIYKDKKMHLAIDEDFPEKYIDAKDVLYNETFESDGAIQINSIHLGDQEVRSDNKGYLDLNTRSLLLPQQQFNNLKEKVTNINSQCTLTSGSLKCSGSSDITKIKDMLFGIRFGKNILEVPFSQFIDSCKSKQCQILIKQSEDDKIILGEVFLLAFAVRINTSDKIMSFHRLKNALSVKFHELGGSKLKNTEDSGSFFRYFGQFFLFMFKIIIVLAILSLCVNLYYNKSRVTSWIKSKTQGSSDSGYSPAFAQDIENAGVLHGYDPKNASKEFWQQNTVDGI